MTSLVLSVLVSSVLAGAISTPNTPGRSAVYKMGDCQVSTREGMTLGGKIQEYSIDGLGSKDGNYGFLSFEVDPATGQLVGGINTCNSFWHGQEKLKATYKSEETEKYFIYTAQCGSTMAAQDNVMQVVIDKKSGKPAFAFSEIKLAAYSIGPGVHSGPIKSVWGRVKCQDENVKAPAGSALDSRQKIEAVLEKAASSKTLEKFSYRSTLRSAEAQAPKDGSGADGKKGNK